MTRRLLLAVVVCVLAVQAVEAQRWWQRWVLKNGTAITIADIRYVRTDGSNSNNGLTNSAGGAWLTIDKAADTATAGMIVRVQAGTYAARVTPANSGTLGNPITFVADGAVTLCGIDLTDESYLRWIGFTIDTDAGGCTRANRAVSVSGTNTGIEFWNNTIQDANFIGIGSGSYTDRLHSSIVIGNTFTEILSASTTAAIGVRGNNNIFAYNEIDGLDCDTFSVIDGTYNWWVNNYAHSTPDATTKHCDVFQSNASALGLSFNTFEANFHVGNGTITDEHGVLLQSQEATAGACLNDVCGAMTENLFRRNVWHNNAGSVLGADTQVEGAITNTRQVHETIASVMMGSNQTTTAYATLFRQAATAYLFNNLNYQAWGSAISSNISVWFTDGGASVTGADYNLAYDPDGSVTFSSTWTNQANEQSNVDPAFADYASDDFTLQAGSGAIGAAGPLTVTSGSGTGTTFNVASGGGGWFRGPNATLTQYGSALTAGDTITVGTDTVTVVSVSGDAITVTPSFTWSDADPVYWGNDTTPDIGAYPYKAGGYALSATYATVSNVLTVTPSDASLVRFAVCFENGIPTTVDNASPFTCTVTSGTTREVRVYPRYPSKTRWVVATP